MLIVKYQQSSSELIYSLDIMLTEFLGVSYSFEENASANVLEITSLQSNKVLTLNTDFFSIFEKNSFQLESLPKQPLRKWSPLDSGIKANLVKKEIPVIYGKPGLEIEPNGRYHLNLDIFGSAFFMLSRYEEVVKKDKDHYNRFPAYASIAYQAGFLDRPIVNEYTEILWSCLKRLWPNLERKQRKFRMQVSCDVDHPYQCGIKSYKQQIKRIAGDLVKRRSPILAFNSALNYLVSKLGCYKFDINYKHLLWMMDVNEKAGNTVVFNFIAGKTNSSMDGCYSLDEPVVRQLLREIHNRGHEIGLHPSFNTYKDENQLLKESNNLHRVLKEEGISQVIHGGRQHYLRWETSKTAKNWENSRLNYDSTLGFADHAGFRCGVCYPYPLYDLEKRKQLNIIERPLIVMEGVVIDNTEMGYGETEKALRYMEKIKSKVEMYNGDFALLWHNTRFDSSWNKRTYENLISK